MLKESNNKARNKDLQISDVVTTYGRGIVAGNPKLCLKCRKPIRSGEAWIKHTSALDPKFGRYSVIFHARCEKTK